MSSEETKRDDWICLTVGLSAQIESEVKQAIGEFKFISAPIDLEQLMEIDVAQPACVLCESKADGPPMAEVAQLLRMKYQDVPIYLVCQEGAKAERKALIKNGLTDVFFLPLDYDTMLRVLHELLEMRKKGGRVFRSVKLLDLQPETVLEFDTFVYLAANNKHVKYSEGGSIMAKERMERLKKHNMTSLFVSPADLPKVYRQAAQTLKALGSSSEISETERAERLHNSVRDLVSGLFSDVATGTEGTKQALEDCQLIVRNYVASGGGSSWYERVLAAVGSGLGTYSHASNVSTYASLFAIGLGFKNAEEIALAGLLHDIGLAKVPLEVQKKSREDMTPLERHSYDRHPEFAIDMIRERKMVVSELVHKIILQHHESFNGDGFPKQLRGNRICEEAQILAFADRFDELTALVPGRPRKTPAEAVRELNLLAVNDPSKAFIEPKLMKRLISIFPPVEEDAEAVA